MKRQEVQLNLYKKEKSNIIQVNPPLESPVALIKRLTTDYMLGCGSELQEEY